MIRLRNNPIAGSSVKIALSFRDPVGNYYVPVSVNYTFLALNSDKESWSVVNDLYEVPLDPASTIPLTIPNVSTIEGTTLTRKIVVKYQAYVDNEYTDFVDEVNFDIQPMPTIINPPEPPVPQNYIKFVDCTLVGGSIVAAPTLPVFKVTVNMPADITEAVVKIRDDVDDILCTVTPNLTATVFTIYPDVGLKNLTDYELFIDGFKSADGHYTQKEPFVFKFTTVAGDPKIQPEKDVTITENSIVEVVPDGQSEGIAKVTITVDIPIQEEKTIDVIDNGVYEIIPDEGYTAIERVVVNVDGGAVSLYAYDGDNGITFYFTREVTESGEYTVIPDPAMTSRKPIREYQVNVDEEEDIIELIYTGSSIYLERNRTKDILR